MGCPATYQQVQYQFVIAQRFFIKMVGFDPNFDLAIV